MPNTDARVEALLNSLVGCDFLVTLVESGIPPEDFAEPKVSLWLVLSPVDVDTHGSIHSFGSG